MYVLEATPANYDGLVALMDAAAIPRAAVFTFLEHSRLDPEHPHELWEILDDAALCLMMIEKRLRMSPR
jgi:hypothetical protein